MNNIDKIRAANASIAELEARLKEAEGRVKTLEAANASWKRYHDAGSAAHERAEKAEADAERLRAALTTIAESSSATLYVRNLAVAALSPADGKVESARSATIEECARVAEADAALLREMLTKALPIIKDAAGIGSGGFAAMSRLEIITASKLAGEIEQALSPAPEQQQAERERE